MQNDGTIAVIRAEKAEVADIRYRMAVRLKTMLVAGRLYENTWMIRTGEERRHV